MERCPQDGQQFLQFGPPPDSETLIDFMKPRYSDVPAEAAEERKVYAFLCTFIKKVGSKHNYLLNLAYNLVK